MIRTGVHFDLATTEKLADMGIDEIYGNIPGTGFGGGREDFRVGTADLDLLKDNIKAAHKGKTKVNYTMNASCFGDLDNFTDLYNSRLRQFIARLQDIGIDGLTVAHPLFLEMVKQDFPDLEIVASTIAHVDSIQKFRYFVDLGADRVVISLMEGRNFPLLKRLESEFPGKVELIVNEPCVFQCPWRLSHYNIQTHTEKPPETDDGRTKQYPYDRCWKAVNYKWPFAFLTGRWIRPEDLDLYREKTGVQGFKITGRTLPDDWILRVTETYLKKEYDGNFLDLTPLIKRAPNVPTKYSAESGYPVLDNKSLDGFMQNWPDVDCRSACLDTCHYCAGWADKLRRSEWK